MHPLNPHSFGPAHQRVFGPVRVGWTPETLGRQGYRVEVWWAPAGKILDTRLDATRPSTPFSAQTPGEPKARVSGSLHFQPSSRALLLSLDCPPEFNFQDLSLQPAPPTPAPPVPPTPSPPTPAPSTQGPDEVEPLDELFPYIHLRAWPRPSPESLALNFVECTLPREGFYQALVEARAGANPGRTIQALALAFLNEAAPWTGLFARDSSALLGLASRLGALAQGLREAPPQSAAALAAFFEQALNQSWAQIAAQVCQPEFATQLARAWQTFFALNVVLGDDLPALGEMSDTLVVARALQALPARPDWPDWRCETIASLLRAHLRLPADAFPVPPAGAVARCTVQPYAVGQLQRVRRRLQRYRLGAVAHIENVMAGERKLNTRSEQLSELDEDRTRTRASTATESLRVERALSVESAVEQALSEAWQLDYSATYGPAQPARQTGYRRLNMPDPSNPPATLPEMRRTAASDQHTGRALMQRALRRYTSDVARERLRVLRRDAESRHEQCLDRRSAEAHLRGIYRWVDLVYECREEHCGHRLLVELVLPRPGALFAAQTRAEGGPVVLPPATLESLGVKTLEDVSADPDAPTYFAKLAAALGVTDVTPPPALTVTLAEVVRDAEPSLDVPLPPGYLARQATLTLLCADATLKATCSVGTRVQPVDANTPATVAGLGGLSSSVPVAVAPAAAAASWQLAVSVLADASPALVRAWQAEVYAGLAQAAAHAARDWRARIASQGGRPIAANPLATREAIRRALRRQSLAECLSWAQAQTGADDARDRWLPAQVRWLEQALEWDELSYQLIEDPLAPGAQPAIADPADPRLAAFVEAAFAHVLVPVRPGHEFALIYFLASGLCWPAAETAVPAFGTPVDPAHLPGVDPPRWVDVSLAVALASTATPPSLPVHTSWTELLPSAMTVLQADGNLPSFDMKESRHD